MGRRVFDGTHVASQMAPATVAVIYISAGRVPNCPEEVVARSLTIKGALA